MKKMIAMMLAVMIFLTSCASSDGGNASSPGSTPAPTEKPTPEPTAEPTPEPTPVPNYKAGDTVTLGDWEVTLVGCEITDGVQNGTYTVFKADEGNRYVVVTLTVKNIGTKAASFLPSFSMGDDVRAKLLYQGEYEFSATNLLGHSDELHDKRLNPLSSTNGLIAFQIAEDAAAADELVLTLSMGSDIVKFDLGGDASASATGAEGGLELAAVSGAASVQDPEAAPEPEVTPESEVTPMPEVTPEPQVTPMPEVTPEPEVTPAPEAQNGEELPANFSEWVPYNTSDWGLIVTNIQNGNVICYNGQYWASPEYANSIANEEVVYFHDISEDDGQDTQAPNRYGLLDLDLSEWLEGNDSDDSGSYDLDGVQ